MKNIFPQRCSHLPECIFTMDGVDYYASDQENALKFNGDVIINLSIRPDIPQQVPKELREYYNIPSEEIMVPWPDFDKPKVKISFWGVLHGFIKHKKWKTACIHCGHGHGRTGTAMSCILVASCGHSAMEAVELIRENYCIEAVETSEQCFYIMEVDEYYNKRQPSEENFPLPSMLLGWEKIQDETIKTNMIKKI